MTLARMAVQAATGGSAPISCSKARRSGKVLQASPICWTQRLKMAKHQGCHLIAASKFDLRASLFGIKRKDQFTQRYQHGIDMGRQNMANLHIRDIAAFSLMETNQHRPFFVNVANRESGPVSVPPGWAFNRPHDVLGLDFAQMPEIVFKNPLFDCQLRCGMQMLHFAAPTGTRMQTKMRACGADPL
jgi:hypothetical protein